MNHKAQRAAPSFAEFVIIISSMMSLTALSIDTMLPALPMIGSDLGVRSANDRQLVVSTIFLGIAIGQLFFGPLSDRTGRKPAIYTGYAVYICGALLSVFAGTFPMMLVGRLLQGIGVSAPRAITLALVRDRYKGRTMARVMSFVMTVFILVPMIAPTLGQAILSFAGWRSIFIVFILIAMVTLTWFAIRMPETLAAEDRAPFSLKRITAALLEIIRNRTAIGYTVASGLIHGAFLGYLNSAQQIFQEHYTLGDRFPLIFAIISFSLGFASFLNARLVMRFGMRFLVRRALAVIFALGVVILAIFLLNSSILPFWVFMIYIMMTIFCVGILFGNQNSLAMEPLGHLAGIGAAVVGSLQTFISMTLGTLIGRNFNGTVLPVIIGFIVLSGITYGVVHWIEKK